MTQSAKPGEKIDYSTLFKLTELARIDVVSYAFYEVGLKKCIALASKNELLFLYITPENEKLERKYEWDFVNNPIDCMCFEPTGTWVTIVTRQKVILAPFLPLFLAQDTYDYKWSLTDLTSISCGLSGVALFVVWWLTVESENVLVIALQKGTIMWFSLDSLSIVGELKVSGDIIDLQICFDDTLDVLALIISAFRCQQWKLILEHRSVSYNWLNQIRATQVDKEKKEGFMSYIKQLSKDKINSLTQGSSKDKNQAIDYSLKPEEYLPEFRRQSNTWALSAQYVNGNHFLTAFDIQEGTLVLESPEKPDPTQTLLPDLVSDNTFKQGLWSQRLIYLLKKNGLEIHSSAYSNMQSDATIDANVSTSKLWTTEVKGNVLKAYLVSTREPIASQDGWKEPTFLCDLKLPRFNLEPCLIITSQGAFLFNTVCSACEWFVSAIMRGGSGVEKAAAALAAPMNALLTAAVDMLLARNKVAPAQYLYELTKESQAGWLARLGVFGRLKELSNLKQLSHMPSSVLVLKYLADVRRRATRPDDTIELGNKLATLNKIELYELSCFATLLGLWSLLPIFSIHRGHPDLLLKALKHREHLCRGGLNLILKHRTLVPLLDKEAEGLLEYLAANCNEFDFKLLKHLCLLLCPLQEQYRPVMRDLRQRIKTPYTHRMRCLIDTFIKVSSALDLKSPTSYISKELEPHSDTWKTLFTPKRRITCGISNWAVVDNGQAKVMLADIPIVTELIGRVIDITCGKDHTLVLTENGLYASGDNTFGQLGVGRAWPGGLERESNCAGDLFFVHFNETTPLLTIAAGQYHSAAVDFGGRLFTWGWGVHGQLGLCSMEDEYSPRLVTKLQGRKVLTVQCGICHTVALLKSGEVYCFGAGVFGQLGTGNRNKSSVPIKVRLNDPVTQLAVGYFHTLALTFQGDVWTWGASPQTIRIANASLVALQTEPPSPTNTETTEETSYTEPHMLPSIVYMKNVEGVIVQIAAGWHHSCLLTDLGTVYTWGLNHDGQLGVGNRTAVPIPVEVKINPEIPTDIMLLDTPSPEEQMAQRSRCDSRRAQIVCGAASTVYIDDEGRIFMTGNIIPKVESNAGKPTSKIVKMKTTKRVIKIPTNRAKNQLVFQYFDRIDNLIHSNNTVKRHPIDIRPNPLATIADFKRETWIDELIILLKPWIETDLSTNPNMGAKLAFHNEEYDQCLDLILKALNTKPVYNNTYLKHTETVTPEPIKDIQVSMKKEENQALIESVIAKRIKDISMSFLNGQPNAELDYEELKKMTCVCSEDKYLLNNVVIRFADKEKAVNVIEKCLDMFPMDTKLWETCFCICKKYFLDNNLPVGDLEVVLHKYMKVNPTAMASAVLCSVDNEEYNEILTPTFYLNMCSEVLDNWV